MGAPPMQQSFQQPSFQQPSFQQPSFQQQSFQQTPPPNYQQSFPSAAPGGSTGAFFQPPGAPAQPPKRREMAPPKDIDDILQTFQEVRQAEVNSHPIFSPPQQQSPAAAALSEIQSIHSEDIASQGTAATGKSGRRRKPQLPVGNSMSLNV